MELHQLCNEIRTRSWSVGTAPHLLTLSLAITTTHPSQCCPSVALSTIVGNLCHYALCQAFLQYFIWAAQGRIPLLPALQHSAQHSRDPTVWATQMLPQYLKRRNNNRKQSRVNPGAPAGKHHLETREGKESSYKQHGLELTNKKYTSLSITERKSKKREE